jgi:hypothetical protein
MKLTKFFQIGLALTLAVSLFFAVVSPAMAQSPITAEVDRNSLSTNETLVLSITVNGGKAGSPQMPMMDGFQVVGTNRSSQIRIINGKISSQTVFNYVLQPTQPGTLTIPGIPVVVDQQTYVTQPITIEVTQGSAPVAPQQNLPVNPTEPTSEEFNGQEVFVESEVDNANPYVGEQITHTFRFYRSINLYGQPSYEGPSFNGFWNESETGQIDYDMNIGNRLYRVVELTTVLFPTSAGEQIIDSAALTLPGSLFTRGTRLTTTPITVDVQPLPSPTPEGFHGAVGQFSITTSLDTDQVTVNEPVTLKIELSGIGNFSNLPDPEMPVLDDWRTYESTSTVNSQLYDGQFQGNKITEQLMVPGNAGDFTIPSIRYTYFDPELGDYQVVSSEPLVVHVFEGTAGGLASGVSGDPNGGSQPVEIALNDIRHIKSVPETLETTDKPRITTWAYWSLWLLPMGLVVADFVWRRHERFRAENPETVRSSRAQKNAYAVLAQARKDNADLYAIIGAALTGYLRDRLGQPITGLTQTELGEFLTGKGVPPPLVKQTQEMLTFSEMGRYAPSTGADLTPDKIIAGARRLIARLEKVLD